MASTILIACDFEGSPILRGVSSLGGSGLTIAHRSRGAAVLASLLFGTSVHAGERDGGLMGWVESTRGVPVAGAVVSVFGKGIRGGSLVTVADSAGQFALPALPAGSYTVRALGTGHEPAAARKVTVVPERDSVFTVSLTPIGEIAAPAAKADAPAAEAETLSVREWQWLLRHRRRSVLEAGEEEAFLEKPPPAAVVLAARGAWVPELAGSVELVTSPSALGLDSDMLGAASTKASQGAVRLQGRLADAGRWSLGGLVTEAENRTWRMGAEFMLEPGGSHQIQTGAGYGTNYLRNPTSASADALVQHSVGAAFVKDRFALGRNTWGTVGARYAYLGFLNDREPRGHDAGARVPRGRVRLDTGQRLFAHPRPWRRPPHPLHPQDLARDHLRNPAGRPPALAHLALRALRRSRARDRPRSARTSSTRTRRTSS